ncbi:hypothetical protein [Klebsiella pneumoniae]|uniref:hypothetical protein n=1 Tax=Klebsiella pneumoniae TaxID=573 RepID=UPI0013D8D45C|nr:hypothetical protein [Klebsiella pneumoniae]
MTISLQAVNELIASLESAGELSIKETKVMALAKAYQQLAAENVALKQFPEQIVKFISRLGTSEIGSDTKETIGLAASRIKTPATDRIVAGIKADEVEEEPFGFVSRSGDLVVIELNGDRYIRDGMPVFVKALREGAK